MLTNIILTILLIGSIVMAFTVVFADRNSRPWFIFCSCFLFFAFLMGILFVQVENDKIKTDKTAIQNR